MEHTDFSTEIGKIVTQSCEILPETRAFHIFEPCRSILNNLKLGVHPKTF